MPQRKSAKSLTHLCVQSIANNLDKFKASKSEKDIGEDEELSSFECLPSQLVVSIMDAALSNGCPASKDKNLLALLITSRLETLDLTRWTTLSRGLPTKLDDLTVLHLLRTASALRHSSLRSLGFSLSGAVPLLVFKELLPAFPNLKKLNVSYSSGESINDDFLALLSTSCLKLEELRLINCKGVTDVGIGHLCGYHDGAGGVHPGCKSLVRLNVDGTRVTRHGVRLALQHFPKLQIFDYHSTLQIAAEMYPTDGTMQLNLKNLICETVTLADEGRRVGEPYVRGSWIHALRLCPLVVDVCSDGIIKLADEDLTSLLHLDRLKKLSLHACQEISFDGGLLPILKKFGPTSLDSLILGIVPEVNIGSIVEFCSELRELLLGGTQFYSPARPGLRRMSPPQHHLPHLRSLAIVGYDDDLDQPSHSDLSLLLSSAPELENILFVCLDELNDGVLEEAMTVHGFPHLKSFQVQRCPGITKGVVDRLLKLDNPLSLISIWRIRKFDAFLNRNPNLPPHVCHDPAWKEAILKNLDLKMYYCECM